MFKKTTLKSRHQKRNLKLTKWPRLNFSDYSAEEQERDYARRLYLNERYRPHLYLLKINGMWSHIRITNKIEPYFYENKNLFQVYNEIKESYPQHRVKYIINQGLENYLKEEYKKKKIIEAKQLRIKFNERY